LHDKFPAHRAHTARRKLTYLRFRCLNHSPYSPVLAPSGYHLFSGLKKHLKSRHFCPKWRPFLPRRSGWNDNVLIF
jgi:hypothetical protein